MRSETLKVRLRDGEMGAYLALPDRTPAGAIIAIIEIWGVNDTMRRHAHEFAEAGFVCLVPDLFWRQEPGVELSDHNPDHVKKAFDLYYDFDYDLAVRDMEDTRAFLRQQAACNGKVGAVGYCLGGKLCYLMCCRTDIDCAVAYYGTYIEHRIKEARNLHRPFMLHMAMKDRWVQAEVNDLIERRLSPSPLVTIHKYPDAEHAFARHGSKVYRKDDAARALAMPGVLGVHSGADCAADGLAPIPHNPLPSTRDDMKLTGPGGSAVFEGPHTLLPADCARHVGEAVAMVVAESRELALDAAEAVAVEYQALPWVTHSEDAVASAPPVWSEVSDNVLVDTLFGDREGTDRAFARADRVISMKFDVGRCTAVALEPRAALGWYDAASGRYTLYAGTGGAVRQKRDLAAVLRIEPQKLRVVTADVGGNFGSKNRVYVEYGLVLWAARKLGRPVKFTASRSESFVSDYQGRDLVTEVELALAADGRFLALRASNLSNVGARCVSLSPLSKGSGLVTGAYDIPVAALRSRAAFTHTAPTNPYRSSGRPEVNFAIERLIDLAASELGVDRVALRRMNLVKPESMPYRNAVGMTYDSGTYEANLDAAMRIAGWDGFGARREAARARGRLLGRGLANYVESS